MCDGMNFKSLLSLEKLSYGAISVKKFEVGIRSVMIMIELFDFNCYKSTKLLN